MQWSCEEYVQREFSPPSIPPRTYLDLRSTRVDIPTTTARWRVPAVRSGECRGYRASKTTQPKNILG